MASVTRRPERNPATGRRHWLRRLLRRAGTELFRIRYRLLLINALVVAVPIVGIGFARTFEREMLASLEADMIHQGQLVREMILAGREPGGDLRLDRYQTMLARSARHTRTRIRLVAADGQVLADSHRRGPPEGAEQPTPRLLGLGSDEYHPPETPDVIDVASRREVRAALGGRYGSATRLWENRQRVYLFSALPIALSEGGAALGAVYITRSTAPVKFAMFRLRTWLIWILAVALMITAVLSLFLAATIARPLGRLTRIAKRIAAGERDLRLTLSRRDEIGELARAFDTMTQRLDERAHYTGELAANISHEFKSPLTSIRGAAELLCDGAVDDVPARDKFLANIIEDTERLDRLVTRLLELSRFEADDAPREYFDYEALVREVVDAKQATGGAAIELSYRSRTTQLLARRGHLASVLGNLLDNALQHAAPDTAVAIHIADGADGWLRTAVKNRGPVISEATMARMWDRFFTTRAKHGGTGLGLAIVASIVRAHGGRNS
ncbi:MAG: ATP-binding protein, partial [Myxococcota bacterium]